MEQHSTLDQYLYYARRAGYLEGALRLIAEGRTGVRPRLAAQRALDAVGKDWLVNGTPPLTKPLPVPISDARLKALEELAAIDQELELKHGLAGNPMIKAQERTASEKPRRKLRNN